MSDEAKEFSGQAIITIAVVCSTLLWGLVYSRLSNIEQRLKKIEANVIQLQVKQGIEPIAPVGEIPHSSTIHQASYIK